MGFFRRNTGKRQRERNNESAHRRRRSSPPTSSSSSSSCVQKKFPSENSEAIPTTAASSSPRSSPLGERESPLQSFPHLHFARLYIPSFSLFPRRLYVARQRGGGGGREEKHFACVDISLYVHLTCKNFNEENNSCRLYAEFQMVATIVLSCIRA